MPSPRQLFPVGQANSPGRFGSPPKRLRVAGGRADGGGRCSKIEGKQYAFSNCATTSDKSESLGTVKRFLVERNKHYSLSVKCNMRVLRCHRPSSTPDRHRLALILEAVNNDCPHRLDGEASCKPLFVIEMSCEAKEDGDSTKPPPECLPDTTVCTDALRTAQTRHGVGLQWFAGLLNRNHA